MSRPRDPETRLTAWLDEGPTTGPDEGLSIVHARVRSTRQRPGWLVALRGRTMETTLRARPVLTTRVALILLIVLAVSLTAGVAIVGGQLIRMIGPQGGLPAQSALALLPTSCPAGTQPKSGDIATIAGTGQPGYSGDGGPATAATLNTQYGGGVAVDATGSIYVSDSKNHVVRRIGTDGMISTVAGTGASGDTGDGGLATAATLKSPAGLAIDGAGDLYIADFGRIRKVDAAGIISTVAGTGGVGSSGNGGPATDAMISAGQVTIGPDGSFYFDDSNNFRVIDPGGIIRAFAGTGVSGYSGDGGPAVDATFREVNGVAVAANGDVYLGDAGGHRIRKVDASGVISTFAGTDLPGYGGDGGPALEATFDYPGNLVFDTDGNLLVTDFSKNVVRRIDTNGIVTTAVGTGPYGDAGDCGPAVSAELAFPTSVALRDGALVIMDANNYRVRMVVP